jgi:hypothetical protein
MAQGFTKAALGAVCARAAAANFMSGFFPELWREKQIAAD